MIIESLVGPPLGDQDAAPGDTQLFRLVDLVLQRLGVVE
jgi:hypothetical protein